MGDWFLNERGTWSHRPKWKCIVNPILRFFQRSKHAGYKWVIYSRCKNDETLTSPPTLIGYGFGPIYHENES